MTQPSSDKKTAIKEKLLAITQAFLAELGRDRARRALTLDASYERDLGIDSLGRVELFHRIEEAFHVRLAESLMAEAECLADMVEPIESQSSEIETAKVIKELTEKETTYDPIGASSLVEILLKRSKKESNRPHIYLQEEKGGEKIITYGKLYDEAMKIAAGLQDLGIEAGDTISIMLPTSEDFFYCFFGILLIGAVPVPIYPPFRPDRIEEYAMRETAILRNAGVKLLITFHQAERLSDLLRISISSLKTVTKAEFLRKGDKKPKLPTITLNTNALIQYTSGSTSMPKGVLLTHQNLLSNIRAAGEGLKIRPTDVGVSWLPLYHDMGLIGSWFICFYYAIPVVIMSPLSFLSRSDKWLWAIHYHRATLSAAPNFAYELCVKRIQPSEIKGLDLSSWRLTLNGAEAVNPKTIENFTKKFEPFGFKAETMFPVYGLAESTVALTFPSVGSKPKIDTISREAFEKEQKAIKAVPSQRSLQFVSCGSPLSGHEIRIVDEKNQVVPERVIGSLQCKGPSLMVGYYQQPEATEAVMHDGWLDTGDLAYLAEGELYVTGRKKDTIIKAGRNLYPEEIEEVTSQVTGVRKGCVVAFGIFDDKSGTEKLVIVAETGEKSRKKKIIRDEIREKITVVLGSVPDDIILVSPKTVPKTSSGKLQRSSCKKMYLDNKLFKSPMPAWAQILKLFVKSLGLRVVKGFNALLRLFYSLYIGLLMLIFGSILYLSALCLPTQVYASIIKVICRIGIFLMGCPLKINFPHRDKREMVYVANHASYLDAIVLLAVLPKGVKFIAKKELMNVLFLRTMMKKLEVIPVDRMDFSSSLSDTKKIMETLEKAHSLVFFPEGTFTYAVGLRPFKSGAFKVAVDTQTPVCSVALAGTREILRNDEWLFWPGKIEVTFGQYHQPESKGWEEVMRILELTRAEIAEFCGEQVLEY